MEWAAAIVGADALSTAAARPDNSLLPPAVAAKLCQNTFPKQGEIVSPWVQSAAAEPNLQDGVELAQSNPFYLNSLLAA